MDLALHLTAGPPGTSALDGLVPWMIAAAFGCLAGVLALRQAPAARASATLAAGLIAIDVASLAQAWRPLLSAAAWLPWQVGAEVAFVAAAGVGFTALLPGLREVSGATRRVVLAVAGTGFVVILGIAIWAAFATTPAVATVADDGPLRATSRAALAFIAVAFGVGTGLVARRPVVAAWAMSATEPAGGRRVGRLAMALADELVTGRARERAAYVERARLAADIHARLLPDLRRAAVMADAAGVPATVAVGLRQAVSDAESMMESRHSALLEERGLVAALEWLAERTQQRDGIEVLVDLDETDADAELPGEVARAAFRVALLGVDNAIRHARATRIVLELATAERGGSVTIRDDGVGFDPDRLPAHHGRGLADMAAEARSVDGRLTIAPSVSGTVVRLEWPRSRIA